MEVSQTKLPGVCVLTPHRFPDDRGWFAETWNRQRMAEAGLDHEFVQDNHSFSAMAGTVRGLHFQAPPAAQAKLVRVVRGAVLDVAVDARRGSATYGGWVSVELSAENARQLLIPKGFLHGFVTLLDCTEVLYKVDAGYAPECEGSVRFDDPDLGIDWGLDPADITLSKKDADGIAFASFDSPFHAARP